MSSFVDFFYIEQKRQEIAEIKQAIQRKTRDLLTAPNAMLKVKLKKETRKLRSKPSYYL